MSQLPTDNPTGYGDLPYVMSGLSRRRNPYDQRRQMALGMMQGGMDASPVAHPLQGASRLAQALVGSLMMGKVDSDEAAADKARQDEFSRIAGIADPQERLAALGKIDPEAGARYAGQVAMQEIAAKRNADMFQQGGAQIAAGYGMAPSGGGPTGPQQAAMPPEQAKATAQQYVQYLVQNHGFKPEEAAQMVGNLYQESGFNPTALHDNNTGFGMGGWRLDRRDALLKSAQEQGRDPRDPQFQLDFYANELKSRPEYAQLQQAQTPEARQAALMTYFRPAGWTPQAPQNGHGFGARVQYGQTFAGGGAPSPQGQLPIPQPPGAAPQGMPAPPDVPRPQPTPELLARAEQMYKDKLFGDNARTALPAARQWVEQQLENQWTRDRDVANRNWQVQREDVKTAQAEARKAADEERKRTQPTPQEMAKFREARIEGGRIIAALRDFEAEASKDSGARSILGATTPANTAYNVAALLAKGEALFNLGVLNGPDLDIIRRTLPDPSTVRGGLLTKPEERRAAVNKVIGIIEDGIARKEREFGIAPPQTEGGGASAPAQQQGGGLVPPPDAVDAELRRRGLLK